MLTHLKGLKSAPQHAIAIAKACWQGEAVAAVVAKTRALAEDAAELVGVEYEPLAPGAECLLRVRFPLRAVLVRRGAVVDDVPVP